MASRTDARSSAQVGVWVSSRDGCGGGGDMRSRAARGRSRDRPFGKQRLGKDVGVVESVDGGLPERASLPKRYPHTRNLGGFAGAGRVRAADTVDHIVPH